MFIHRLLYSSSHATHDTMCTCSIHIKAYPDIIDLTIILTRRQRQSRPRRLRQRTNLLLEEFLCLLPDTRIAPILQLHQAGEERVAEHLRALTREERREMVNADHAQWRALCPRRKVDRHRGLVKCRGNGIYRDRVMRVRSVGVR